MSRRGRHLGGVDQPYQGLHHHLHHVTQNLDTLLPHHMMCHTHPFYPALRQHLLCHFPLWGWGAEEGRPSAPWRQELVLNYLVTYLVDREAFSVDSDTIYIVHGVASRHQEQGHGES